MALSLERFTAQLVDSRLMGSADVEAFVAALASPPVDGEQLARELVRHKKLTAYQAQQIYAGKGKTLVLGNYRILDTLGQGGMGMVFKAEHQRMKRLVALKMLSPVVTESPAAVRRFQREVEAAARLRHPNIVAADDADEAHGLHFLVMEYVEGSDLSAWVKKHGPMPLEQALNCILQAARGLQYAHGHGIVHRDIKPANLLLDQQGTIKILDMGLARLATASENQDELTSTGQIMGTVDYMAPEQAVSTRHADARSDIYSLCVTLWYLLTARPLYRGDSAIQKLMGHRIRPIPSLAARCAAATPALEAVFAKMVAKAQADRYQSMTEVIAALQQCQTTVGDAPLPSIRAGEDTRLQAFLEGIDQPPVARGSPAAVATTPAPAEVNVIPPAADVTVNSAQVPGDTDPQTENLLPRVPLAHTAWRLAAAVPLRPLLPLFKPHVLIPGIAALLLVALCLWITLHDNASDQAAAVPPPAKDSAGDDVTPPTPTAASSPADDKAADTAVEQSAPPPDSAPPSAIAPFDETAAKRHQQAWAEYLATRVETTSSTGMKMILIPPGEFLMGSSDEQVAAAVRLAERLDNSSTKRRIELTERPQHRVKISKPFWMSATEVTVGQFKQFAQAMLHRTEAEVARVDAETNPTKNFDSPYLTPAGVIPTYLDPGYPITDQSPAAAISWHDAVAYCQWLSRGEHQTYRLPTEAEWEYACRAGTATQFFFGDDVAEIGWHAWYITNAPRGTQTVATKLPNAFGLSDMAGNVREWCQDYFDTDWYRTSPQVDPIRDTGNNNRILRGGAAGSAAPQCRSADRSNWPPSQPHPYAGFRLVREAILPFASAASAQSNQAKAAATPAAAAPPRAVAPFDANQAKSHQQAWAAHLQVPVEFTNSLGARYRLIPPGEFTMGSSLEEMEPWRAKETKPNTRQAFFAEVPAHRVGITRPFYAGVHEVTYHEFSQFASAQGFKPDGPGLKWVGVWASYADCTWDKPGWLPDPDEPVVCIGLSDAKAYCAWLSGKEGRTWRLPTEAEWEYMARAGTTTAFSSGDHLPLYAARVDNVVARPAKVGSYAANPFGLFDIHGNVWERTGDWYDADAYRRRAIDDPQGAAPSSPHSVDRGGSWYHPIGQARSAYRGFSEPTNRVTDKGFRIVCEVKAKRD